MLPSGQGEIAPPRNTPLLTGQMQTLAEENLSLFLHCFNKGHDTLQITAIHVLSDILTTHPSLLVTTDESVVQKSIFKIFAKATKASHAPDVQSAATTALCKLMLTTVIREEELLKQLVICYFNPATKDNVGVRQALTYFLPVYCHSRRENMERMQKVAVGTVHALIDVGEALDEEEEMVGMGVVASMLVDWTDARNLVVQDSTSVRWEESGRKEVKTVNGDIHLDLAESLLEKIMSHGCPSKIFYSVRFMSQFMLILYTEDERKILVTMLSKLHVMSNSSQEKLRAVYGLVTEAIDNKIAYDATSRNTLNKLHAVLSKIIGEAGASRDNRDEDGLTVMEQGGVDAPAPELGEKTIMEMGEDEDVTEMKDSLLEELLDDEDENL